MTKRKKLAGFFAGLSVLVLLLSGCGADARHEIYRVFEGQNGEWTLEVRRWVEYGGSLLLPNDLTYLDSGSYTYVAWRLEYHGTGKIDDCQIAKVEVKAQNNGWDIGDGSEEINYFDFNEGWKEKTNSPGIELYDSEDCFAVLTDTDGRKIRINAPLILSKGDKM